MTKIYGFLVVLITTQSFSQILFNLVPPPPPAVQNIAYFYDVENSAIAYADVDADGDMDVIISGKIDNNDKLTALYKNDGNGNFTKSSAILENVSQGDLKFSDVDGDGDQDLFVTGLNQAGIAISKLYLNNSLGSFIEATGSIFTKVYNSNTAFLDVDGDSDLDLFITGKTSSSKISELYINDGLGNFTLSVGNNFEGVAEGSVSFADVDGLNGNDILITGESDTSLRNTKLYLNNGSGVFTLNSTNTFDKVRYSKSVFTDVNGDTYPDLFILGEGVSTNITKLYINDGNGVFSASVSTFSGVNYGSIDVADIDGLNGVDIIISGNNNTNNKITKLYKNNGLGIFTEVLGTTLLKTFKGDVKFIDVDGANGPDIVISGSNNDSIPATNFYINDGLGNFSVVKNTPFQGVKSGAVAFADVDGDTTQDVLITGESITGNIAELYKNNFTGGYTKVLGNPFIGVANSSVAFADVDLDTTQDILITGEGNNDIRSTKLYLNDGNGLYTMSAEVFENVSDGAVAFANVDGKNGVDLIISGENNNDSIVTVIYINDSSGGFTPSSSVIEAVKNSSVTFVNVDGVNGVDLFITGRNESNVKVTKLYLNDGLGNFTVVAGTPFTDVEYGAVGSADIDGDGDFDLLITGLDVNNLKIAELYENNGAGIFTKITGTPFAGVSNGSVSFSDVDGDLDKDVLIIGINNDNIAITKFYVNDGTGNFTEQKTSLDNVSLSAIAFANIDNDGDNDLLVTGSNEYKKSIAKLYKTSVCIPSSSSFTDTVCNSLLSPSGKTIWDVSGIFNDTIVKANGCDSIITVTLTVKSTRDTINEVVCDSLVSPSGNYTWKLTNNYTDTLINSVGCDSIIFINLTVNLTRDTVTENICDSLVSPSGKYTWYTSGTYMDTVTNSKGCDSVMLFNLVINYTSRDTIQKIVCDSLVSPTGQYTWRVSGFYSDTLTAFSGCDSIFTFDLDVRSTVLDTIIDTVCNYYEGDFGIIWDTSGVYTLNRLAESGCLKTTILYLTIKPASFDTVSYAICDTLISPSGKYKWSTTGVYTDTLVNAIGCDSIITFNLTINSSSQNIVFDTVCNSLVSPSGNYTWSTSGIYSDTLLNGLGCDSIITVNLLVNKTSYDTILITACDSLITYLGKKITSSGFYNDTLIASTGCDSIITYNAIVNYASASLFSTTSCNFYISPSGKIWINTAVYNDTIVNTTGCDSIITVNLVINKTTYDTITTTVCDSLVSPSGKYTWAVSGVYKDTLVNAVFCDSIITVYLTVNQIKYTTINSTICDSLVSPSGKYTWTISGVYNDTLTSAKNCDSILTLNLTVLYTTTAVSNNVVCDSLVSASGKYTWITSGIYSDTVLNSAGCDSIITYNLTVNNSSITLIADTVCDSLVSPSGKYTWKTSGIYSDTLLRTSGCDSILTFSLLVNYTTYDTINTIACDSLISPSGKYTWKTSGTYYDSVVLPTGCDLFLVYNLVISSNTYASKTDSACNSFNSPSGNYTWTTSGIYSDTIVNSTGCDSIITLNLTIYNSSAITLNDTVCGSLLSPSGNKTWASSGTYNDTLINSLGCDSIITVNLVVYPKYINSNSYVACDSIVILGNTYTTSGVYTDSLLTTNGCDSITILNITINKSVKDTIIGNICDSIVVAGNTYKNTGLFYDTLQTASGCDSILVIDIVVSYSSIDTIVDTVCNSITIGANTYTTSGTYRDTLQSVSGCDSIIVLKVVVKYATSTSQNVIFCRGDSVNILGNYYYNNTTVYDTLISASGCDSIHAYVLSTKTVFPLPNLGNNRQVCNNVSIQLNPGIYNSYLWSTGETTNVVTVNTQNLQIGLNTIWVKVNQTSVGCSMVDSVVLDVLPCVTIGIDEAFNNENVIIYPNPTEGEFTIDFIDKNINHNVVILDALGKELIRFNTNQTKELVDLSSYENGIYLIKIDNFISRIIKQ